MSAARVTLVTGFPNFRATCFVSHVLEQSPDHVWAVITPEESRYAESYRDRLPAAQRERLRLFVGQSASIDMGLSGAEYRELAAAVGCIQHLARTKEASEGGQPAEVVNIGGMREVLELARAAPHLGSLVIHSSVAVSGDYEGLFGEADLEAGQRFAGPGPATLARAELMARRQMHRLPIVVLRTGQVIGPSGTGAVDALEGVYLLILLILSSPQDLSALLPRLGDAPLHVVPIDCLVRVAAAASSSQAILGRTLHLTDPKPMTVRVAFNRCLKIRARLSAAGLAIPTMGASLRRDGVLRDGLQSILLRPRAFINAAFRNVRYGTEGAEAWLRDTGVSFPPLESYFEHLVRHVAQAASHPPSVPK